MSCKIHNIGFYKPKPRAIYSMALNEKKLAVSRSDASIEIWNLKNTIFIEREIASSPDNCSVEGLAWFGNRLFSVGLHGLLIEYDLKRLTVRNRAAVTGEAAFCMDINKSNKQIAIGTEQGYLNIFRIDGEDVQFEKFLDKQEGRILCTKYDPTGEFIVSGSLDAIRIWNVASGHAIQKMSTGRSEALKPTIVWCLEVTNEFMIISGDSRGKLTFWDGKIGAQLESHQSHRADILSICMSEDQNSLYCAGVDPNIVNYVRIKIKEGNQRFVKSIHRKIHEHDVRAMVFFDNKLYSGGADGYFACSFYPPKTLIKSPPICKNPCVGLSAEERLLLLRYPKSIEIWSLGKFENPEDNYTGLVPVKIEPKKLLVYQKIVKDFDGDEDSEGIICSCISNDGKWMMVSTNSGTKLFELVNEDDKLNLVKVDCLGLSKVPSVQAVFSPDSERLIVAPNTGGLQICQLNRTYNNLTVVQKIDCFVEITDVITMLTITACGKYLIAADPESNIAIWALKRNQWCFHIKLPKYKAVPTALAVHPKTLNLVVVYSDNKLIEYDIKRKQFTDFSRKFQSLTKLYPIGNISFDPRANHIIILSDDNSIIIINKNKQVSKENLSKIHSSDKNLNYEVNLKKYKHLVYQQWFGEDEMLAVEVNPLSIMEYLPPTLKQNTFGRK